MKRITRNLVIGFVALVLFGYPVGTNEGHEREAKSGVVHLTLTKKGAGVLSTLRDAGCHPGWLSWSLAESGIPAANLRRLPLGTRLAVPAVCDTCPPRHVAHSSAAILMTDRERQVVITNARRAKEQLAQVSAFKVSAEKAAEGERTAKARISQLEKELIVASDKLSVAMQTKPSAPVLGNIGEPKIPTFVFGWPGIVFAFLLGAIVGLVVGGLAVNQHWKAAKIIPVPDREVQVRHTDDKLYTFRFHSYEPDRATGKEMVFYYECPLCAGKGYPERYVKRHNFRRHLEKAHPELRVAETERFEGSAGPEPAVT